MSEPRAGQAVMGKSRFAAGPATLYGVVLLMAAIAYWTLQQMIIASQDPQLLLKKAIKGDWKGKLSPVLYAVAIALAFRLEWLVPDRRIERVFAGGDN